MTALPLIGGGAARVRGLQGLLPAISDDLVEGRPARSSIGPPRSPMLGRTVGIDDNDVPLRQPSAIESPDAKGKRAKPGLRRGWNPFTGHRGGQGALVRTPLGP